MRHSQRISQCYFTRSIMLLVAILIVFAPSVMLGQASIERPDQVAQNLKELQMVLDDAKALGNRFGSQLEKLKKHMEDLKARYALVSPKSRKAVLLAEEMERVQSEALLGTYEYLRTALSSRDRVVQLLKRTIPMIQQDGTKTKYLSQKIARAQRFIEETRIEAQRIALILYYMDKDTKEQQRLSQELAFVEDQKLKMQTEHKAWLGDFEAKISKSGQSVQGLKSALENSLTAIEMRSGVLDLTLDRIFTLANIRRDYAQTRLALSEVQKGLAALRDYFEGWSKVSESMVGILSVDEMPWDIFKQEVEFEETNLLLVPTGFTDPFLDESPVDISDGKSRAARILDQIKNGTVR